MRFGISSLDEADDLPPGTPISKSVPVGNAYTGKGWALKDEDCLYDSDDSDDDPKETWEEQPSFHYSEEEEDVAVEDEFSKSFASVDISDIIDYQKNDEFALRAANWVTRVDIEHENWVVQGPSTSVRNAVRAYEQSAEVAAKRALYSSIKQREDALRDKDLQDVQNMLENMKLRTDEEAKKLKQDFDGRQKLLWESIDKAIAHTAAVKAEKERKRVEEVERKAKELQEEQRKQLAALTAKREAEQKAKQDAENAKAEAEAKRQAILARDAAKRKEQEERAAAEKFKAEQEAAAQREAEAEIALSSKWQGGLAYAAETRDDMMQDFQEKYQYHMDIVFQNDTYRQLVEAHVMQITSILSKLTNKRSVVTEAATDIQALFLEAYQTSESCYFMDANFYAIQLVDAAEQEILTKVDQAYAIGQCTMLLLTEGIGWARGVSPELAECINIRFSEKCWWVFPAKPPKSDPAMEDVEYDYELGMRRDELGADYAKRETSYMLVYTAICQSNYAVGYPPPESLSPHKLWMIMSNALRPLADSDWHAPDMIATIIEYGGLRLEEFFGEFQVAKLFRKLYELADNEHEFRIGRDDDLDVGSNGRDRVQTAVRSFFNGDKLSRGRDWLED